MNSVRLPCMKRLTTTICLTVALLLGSAGVSFALPVCPWERFQNHYYHNCIGTRTFGDGSKYLGEWRNNKRHGQGTYTWDRGRSYKYVGEWRNGKRHGHGTFTPGPLSIFAGDKYVGEWRNNKRHGQGTFTYANGRKKEGIWKNGEFQYARSAAKHRRDLKNKERKRKRAQQLRQKRRDRYKAALTKCLFDNVEKVINEYAKRIVEAECRRKIKK